MKKITDKSKMRPNLKNERKYESNHKAKRYAKNRFTSSETNKAKRILVKKIGRPLKKDESVEHIKPLSKGGTNNKSNLKVMKRKENYARGAKLKAKMSK